MLLTAWFGTMTAKLWASMRGSDTEIMIASLCAYGKQKSWQITCDYESWFGISKASVVYFAGAFFYCAKKPPVLQSGQEGDDGHYSFLSHCILMKISNFPIRFCSVSLMPRMSFRSVSISSIFVSNCFTLWWRVAYPKMNETTASPNVITFPIVISTCQSLDVYFFQRSC